MQWTGKVLDEQIGKKVLITLEKNKSGAMTREKDHALENSDLLCPAHLFNFLSRQK